jgi:uncharacterized membrane protein YfcA
VSAPVFVIAILVTSVGAGVSGALLGLGGGILLVPILTMFYGVSLRDAMGASIVSVVATSSGAAAAYLESGLSNIRIALFLAMATVSGAIAGAALAGVVPERALALVLGGALLYASLVTLRHIGLEAAPDGRADVLATRFGLEGVYHDTVLARDVRYRATRVRLGVTAMFGAGMLSGLLGIGSGVFKVVAMDHCMRLPMKVSTATSNFMIGITASASAAIYFQRGDIRPVLACPVALGVLAGAYAGTRILSRLRNTTVRKIFLPVLVYLAAAMLLRGFGIRWP